MVAYRHDPRVESWRTDLTNGALDRGYRAPFATAPMSPADIDSLIGSVRVDRTRDVSGWWLVVTGTASDDVRGLVVSLGGTNTTFTGSAFDWSSRLELGRTCWPPSPTPLVIAFPGSGLPRDVTIETLPNGAGIVEGAARRSMGSGPGTNVKGAAST